ncbi:MAG TPA: ParB/RepB/Spo0J family partition protein [Vicinamibacteria bacterium]|nr:ParB/RepB/Spo0J family partition protein [Vicinamibacteria bacterium]
MSTAARRKALGKGLSALIPDLPASEPATAGAPTSASEVPIGTLEPNPFQPRSAIDPVRLAELTASVRESGVVQPILVRPRGGGYQIIAGERRWRAAQAAGLETVPVTVREVPDEQLLELAIVENLQRQELTPLEEAQAFHRLQDEFRLTQEEIARRVGRERPTIANTLRLLRLPRELRELLAQGRLDAGHARALLALEREEEQVALGREAARRALSVREVERRVALLRAPRRATRGPRGDANTRAAEERLRSALGSRVEIARRGKGGQIRVLFTSEAELNRLYELLLRAGRGR